MSVSAIPDEAFNNFLAKLVPGFLVKCLKTLAPRSGKMYRKVDSPSTQPEDFELPFNGRLPIIGRLLPFRESGDS